MHNILVILLLFLSSVAYSSNHAFGLKLNGGVSRISNPVTFPYWTWNVRFGPSGSGGFYYNYQFDGRSILGAELLFSQIEGREEAKGLFDDGARGYETFHRSISYISLPVFYGFNYNKFTFQIGVQVSYALRNNTKWSGYFITSDGSRRDWDFTRVHNIDNFDFGPKAIVSYNIRDNFAIEASYYYGVNDIASKINWISVGVWRVQQATIGIKYAFWDSKRLKTK